MTDLQRAVQARLRTGISVTTGDGVLHATVELHGELCPSTAAGLRSELDQLVEDGTASITVDVQHLQFCTSHGLDVFDEIDRRLRARHGGHLEVRVDGASPIVRRVVHVVKDRDTSFSPRVAAAHGASEPVALSERSGDSTS